MSTAHDAPEGGEVSLATLEQAIWQEVGECLAWMPHSEVSEKARRKIEAAITRAIGTARFLTVANRIDFEAEARAALTPKP